MLASSSQPASSSAPASSAGASYIGATFATSNGGSSALSLSVHSGALVGDLLLAQVGHRAGSGGAITGPSGWSGLAQINSGTELAQRIFTKIAASGDLSDTHQFNLGATPKAAAVLLVFRGINPSNTLAASSGQANASAPAIEVPGLTLPAQSTLLVACAGKAHGDSHAQVTGWTLDSNNASASSAQGGGGTRNRVSAQYRASTTANPSSVTIAAGTTPAVSIGQMLALAVGAEPTPSLVCEPSGYTVTGRQSALTKAELFTAAAGSFSLTGRQSTMQVGTAEPIIAAPAAYSVTGASATLEVGGVVWQEVDTVGSGVGTFSDTTAQASTTYKYRVVAVNPAGETSSNEVQVTSFPSNEVQLVAEPSEYVVSGRANSWTDPIRESLDTSAYAVVGRDASLVNPPLDWEVVDTVGFGASNYQDTGLDPATGYVYRVIAVNSGGETSSNTAVAFTLSDVLQDELVASPDSYAVTGSQTHPELPLRAESNAYAVTGVDAALEYVQQVTLSSDAYWTEPRDAELVATMHLSADAGSYASIGFATMFAREFDGQQAVPVADVSAGGWTPSSGSDLYAMVDDQDDDPPVDDTYITTVNPQEDEAVLALAGVNTPLDGEVTMLVRTRKGGT